MMAKKHKSKPRNSNKGPVFVDGPEMQKVKWSTAKSPSPNSSPDFGESKVPTTRAATRMAARGARRAKATRSKSPSGKGFVQTEAKTAQKVKWSTAKSPSPNSSPDFGESKVPTTRAATRMAARAARRSRATRSKSPSGKGFVQTEAKTAKKKVAERKKAAPEAPQAEEAVQVVDAESEEERQFRERYLSAEKETEPEWKQQMDAAKTKEDRFRVGLQVGDFKTSYGILAEELIGSFADGDKERLDEFLTKAGVASWQLALIQLVVIGVRHDGKEAHVETKKLEEAPGLHGRPTDAESEKCGSRGEMVHGQITKSQQQSKLWGEQGAHFKGRNSNGGQGSQEAPQAEEAVQVVDAESEEERQFRERYLSAEKETEPEWKQQMDVAASICCFH
eukprot:Skav225038  [mRNA]  locus=scaffold2061:246069:248330:+ [translate_table: standard]